METIDHIISWRPYLTPADAAHLKGLFLAVVPDLLEALGIFVLGLVIYKLTARPLRKLLVRSNVEEWFARIIAHNVYKFVVVVTALVTALGQVGIHVGATLAGIGVAGLALGFIAQDSLANIVAGFLISVDKPFRVGDYISIDKHYGRIELITMRSTRIRTQDNTYVVIPNQKLINDVLVDHTSGGDTRVNIRVSIIYEAAISAAREVILAEVRKVEGILERPGPDVVVEKLGDSGVELLVRVWVANSAHERQVYFRTTEAAKNALQAAGIEIAYPHVQLVGKHPTS